jgi:hypothetical protein
MTELLLMGIVALVIIISISTVAFYFDIKYLEDVDLDSDD